MTIRSRCIGLLVALVCGISGAAALAQTGAPVMRSFTVDQVPQLAPGTELVFRVDGTAGGALSLRVDGVANLIGLPETKPGAYEGAYTISIRDKIRFDSKAVATLKVGDRQVTATLVQPLLTAEAQAKAVAAASPPPVPAPLISRLETKNSGALSGGNELSFFVSGTAAGKASVSMDGGKTNIPLAEEKSGQYSATYTIKTRDQFTDATPVVATLAVGDKKATAVKALAPGVLVPTAVAEVKCDSCGVVASVTKVKVKGKPNYVGAIAGGVVGGVLGNQVGGGTGKTVATVVGTVGGAVAGNEIEKQVRSETHYDVVVKLDNGTTKTVKFQAEPVFKVGAKVKLSGDTLVANN